MWSFIWKVQNKIYLCKGVLVLLGPNHRPVVVCRPSVVLRQPGEQDPVWLTSVSHTINTHAHCKGASLQRRGRPWGCWSGFKSNSHSLLDSLPHVWDIAYFWKEYSCQETLKTPRRQRLSGIPEPCSTARISTSITLSQELTPFLHYSYIQSCIWAFYFVY